MRNTRHSYKFRVEVAGSGPPAQLPNSVYVFVDHPVVRLFVVKHIPLSWSKWSMVHEAESASMAHDSTMFIRNVTPEKSHDGEIQATPLCLFFDRVTTYFLAV